MRKLAVVEYVSLDGVIQPPGVSVRTQKAGFAHGGWTCPFRADHRRDNSQLFPRGKQLFNHGGRDPVNLRLVESTVTGGGLVIRTYQPA